MPERVFVFHQQMVEEGVPGVHAMAENDMAQLVGDHRSQAGFVGQNVDQSPAKDDRVAERKGLQRSGHQHAAAHCRIDVEIFVTSRLLTTVSRTLSTSPRGAISPIRSKWSATFSSACRSQARWACTGVRSLVVFVSS